MRDPNLMTLDELRSLADALHIPNARALSKPALLDAILAAQATEADSDDAHTPAVAEEPLADDAAAPQSDEEDEEDEDDAENEDDAEDEEDAEDGEPETTMPMAAASPPPPARHPYEGIPPLLPPLELGGIPVGYDRDHLGLMVQSPTAMFCYWSLRQHEADLVDAWHVELHIFDVTDHHPALIRRERVDPRAGRWFLHNLTPDRRYRAALGAVHYGDFQPRLQSADATTPPDRPSRVLDTSFVTISLQEPQRAPRLARPHEALHQRRGGLTVTSAGRRPLPAGASAIERHWAALVPLMTGAGPAPTPAWWQRHPQPELGDARPHDATSHP